MFNWDNLRCKILNGNFSLGSEVTVEIDGKKYTRKVFDSPDDLYIRVRGYRFYFQDFIRSDR